MLIECYRCGRFVDACDSKRVEIEVETGRRGSSWGTSSWSNQKNSGSRWKWYSSRKYYRTKRVRLCRLCSTWRLANALAGVVLWLIKWSAIVLTFVTVAALISIGSSR